MGKKTSSRPRGTSRHRVGRFSYMVIAKRLAQNRFNATSRSSSKRLPYAPAWTRCRISVPVGALVSKSRRITAAS
jgi:hypothetical protein